MDKEIQGADDEKGCGEPFELFRCGHCWRVINHLVGRDFLVLICYEVITFRKCFSFSHDVSIAIELQIKMVEIIILFIIIRLD